MTTLVELEARLDNLLSTAQAETADIDIFAPITEKEECPICLIPFPNDDESTKFYPCCGKNVCIGCVSEHMKTEIKNGADHTQCAFCRKISPKNDIKALKKLMKRDNNPIAFMEMAFRHKSGRGVLQSETKSLEMYIRAAELGHADAYLMIGQHYNHGLVVEANYVKALAFWEIAAKKGLIRAHLKFAEAYENNSNKEKSIKYLKVAACAGHQQTIS